MHICNCQNKQLPHKPEAEPTCLTQKCDLSHFNQTNPCKILCVQIQCLRCRELQFYWCYWEQNVQSSWNAKTQNAYIVWQFWSQKYNISGLAFLWQQVVCFIGFLVLGCALCLGNTLSMSYFSTHLKTLWNT